MTTVHLRAAASALVLIDLQHGIVARTGAPHSTGDVVQRCAALAARFRTAGATVVYVRVDLANFLPLEVDLPGRDPNAPLPPASASQLVPEAGCAAGDLQITKRHWSALLGTDLAQQLRARGIDTIVLGGISTSIGVESTARDAAGMGFNVVFAEEAMTALAADQHAYAVSTIFPRIGRVRSAAEIAFG